MSEEPMSDEEIINKYQKQIDEAEAQQRLKQAGEMGQYVQAATMFAGQPKQNLVEWQLDFRPELEDIERLLRSDILVRNTKGQEFWIQNPNTARVLFNPLGVSDIIREIRMFLNKNKVLSNYQIEEIKPRIRMLGHELRVLIYNNYEEYGIDNNYKMNNYSMVVLTIMDMIESAYRRALNGEERRDLNSARIVQQQDPVQPQYMGYPNQPQPSKKGFMSFFRR